MNFLERNIAIVGANGSGKTRLTDKFHEFLGDDGIVIPSHRIFNLPDSISIPSFEIIKENYQRTISTSKVVNNPSDYSNFYDDFQIYILSLITEHISEGMLQRDSYRNQSIDEFYNTKLEQAFEIWNELFYEKRLEFIESSIKVKNANDDLYELSALSDGEKSGLYLVSQVLLAPKNSFIVTDEPEVYFHKSIVPKIWDRLEVLRSDCKFIYITHDIDFVVSRNAEKVWVRSFTYPDQWKLENIPGEDEFEFPQELLIELLGTKKDILFCEGKKSSLDYRVYSVLFPKLSIIPVGGCSNVIDYTRAYNKLPNKTNKSFGIIDRDYKFVLSKDLGNIYMLEVAEIENIFYSKNFLKVFFKEKGYCVESTESSIMEIHTKVIKRFNDNLELQVLKYVQFRFSDYVKNVSLQKNGSKEELESQINSFFQGFNFNNFYRQRKSKFESAKDKYDQIITISNDKGLKGIYNEYSKPDKFHDECIDILKKSPEARKVVLDCFSQRLIKNFVNVV